MGKSILSARAFNYPESAIRGLSGFAITAEKNGVKVIPLNLGAPDTATPSCIRSSGSSFLKNTLAIRYGHSGGDPTLIAELVKFYTDRLMLRGVTESNLMITQGASEALELVIFTLAGSGETILTPDPCYSNYQVICYKYGVDLKAIPTDLTNGFHLIKKGETDEAAFKRLSRLVTPKTKAILWSSPGNPTGTVFTKRELKLLLKLGQVYNLVLIADEVYRLLSFENNQGDQITRAPSILDIASSTDLERLVVMDSASKMISFCGARLGIVTAPSDLIKSLTSQASVRGCPSTIGQASLLAINQVKDEYFAKSRAEFLSRRDFLHQGLQKLSPLGISVSPLPPEGAFYLVVDLGQGVNAADYCEWLLTRYLTKYSVEATIFLTPMRIGKGGFYLDPKKGTSEVRIAYVLDKARLKEGLAILKHSLPLYLKEKK